MVSSHDVALLTDIKMQVSRPQVISISDDYCIAIDEQHAVINASQLQANKRCYDIILTSARSLDNMSYLLKNDENFVNSITSIENREYDTIKTDALVSSVVLSSGNPASISAIGLSADNLYVASVNKLCSISQNYQSNDELIAFRDKLNVSRLTNAKVDSSVIENIIQHKTNYKYDSLLNVVKSYFADISTAATISGNTLISCAKNFLLDSVPEDVLNDDTFNDELVVILAQLVDESEV